MTSEDKLEIPKPADHQCKNIDDYVKCAKEVEYSIRDALKCDDIDDMRSNVEDADWHASDLAPAFEDLRESISLVRDWGEGWKTLAKELIEKYEPELLEDNAA